MDAVFAPKDAIDKRQLKALAERSDAKGLTRLAGHFLGIVLAGGLVWLARGSLWLLPAMALEGILLDFLFAPLHETVHATAFRSRGLNRAVAAICGAVILLPSGYFRAFHFAHHRYTQDPDRDPELQRAKPARLGAYLLHMSGLLYWLDQVRLLVRLGRGDAEFAFLPARERAAVVGEARLLLALYAAVAVVSFAAGSTAALTYWLGPLVLGQPALRGFLLAEHVGCPQIPDMLRNTRTTLTNGLVRWLTWNMSYHAEHHAYPALPFHALPAAHALIRPRIAVLAPGYLAVHRALLAALLSGRTAASDGRAS